MARIRSIKPEFFRHFELFQLEKETKLPIRVAFAGLWTSADRRGRFRWVPEELKLDALPYDAIDFSRVLDALGTRGFVVRYACSGSEFGWIPGFERHQVINHRERDSVLPEPPTDADVTRAQRVGDASTVTEIVSRGEGKGREGNKEGKGKEGVSCASAQASDRDFDRFWSAFPRKVGKAKALSIWNRIEPPIDDVLKSLEWQRTSSQWTREGGQYIPHPSTYLNQGRWMDEPQSVFGPAAQRASEAKAYSEDLKTESLKLLEKWHGKSN